MTNGPDLMNLAFAAARHAAYRQETIAGNLANADTPGFRARDTGRFAEAYRDMTASGLRATRAGHLAAEGDRIATAAVRRDQSAVSPNGNSVSVEHEMVVAAEVQGDHNTALAVYRASLDLLRASLGRR